MSSCNFENIFWQRQAEAPEKIAISKTD